MSFTYRSVGIFLVFYPISFLVSNLALNRYPNIININLLWVYCIYFIHCCVFFLYIGVKYIHMHWGIRFATVNILQGERYNMIIRHLLDYEIDDAMALVWKVFQTYEAPDYTQEGTDAFREFITIEDIKAKAKAKEMSLWGCYILEDLTGVICTRDDNHIALLFVAENFHRRGIARKLLETVKEVVAEKDIAEITVNSSPYGVEAYHRLGFEDTGAATVTNGITYTPMVLKL